MTLDVEMHQRSGARSGGGGAAVHRSYRRLRPVTPLAVVQALALLVVVELVLVVWLEPLSSLVGRVAAALVPTLYPRAQLVRDAYLGVHLSDLYFVLPAVTYVAKLAWLAGGALVATVAGVARRLPIPVRVFVGFGAVLVACSAYYLLVFGQLGFDGDGASRFYIRTATVIWVLLPVLLSVASVAVPFTLPERLVLLVACVVGDVAFATVRYALFVWLLGSAGPVPMPMLFLLLGPPLDFVFVVGVASVALARLSRRLGGYEAREAWAWM